MEYLTQKLRTFTQSFLTTGNPQQEIVISSRIDAYLNFVYKIIAWEDITLSWIALLAVNILFWSIVQLEVRLYGVIFLVLLTAFVVDTYFERNGLEQQRTRASKTLIHVYEIVIGGFNYLYALRKENKATFCGTMCLFFLAMSVVAKSISGYLFAYLLILGIFFGPWAVSKLPEEYIASIKRAARTLSTNEGVMAELDLIPFISDKDLNERDPDLDSLLTDRTADSATNSLISGITSMPSYLEVDCVAKDIEEDDLVPATQSYTPNSSDSDSDQRDIKFNSSHFNTSSSEDDSYTRDLKIPQKRVQGNAEIGEDAADAARATLTGILGNLAAMGGNLVANVVGKATPKRHDSESDFEFVEPEEVDLDEENRS